jgi:hypothetical protein
MKKKGFEPLVVVTFVYYYSRINNKETSPSIMMILIALVVQQL